MEGKMSDMNMHTLGAGFVDHGCDRRTRLIEQDCYSTAIRTGGIL